MSENPTHGTSENMSETIPLNQSKPLDVQPISFLPPNIPNIILASRYPGSSSNPFGQKVPTEAKIFAEQEGQARMAEKIVEAEQKRVSKAKEREWEGAVVAL